MMAVDSLGTKRQPQFLDGGAPDIAVDPTAVADYAAEFGNYVADTNAKRLTATSWAWSGLTWYCTDTKITYVFEASAWQVTREDTGWISPTLGGGWSAVADQPVQYRRLNGIVYLKGQATGGADQLFVLPAGFRPLITANKFYAVQNGSSAAAGATTRMHITPGGAIFGVVTTQPNLHNIPPFIAEA